MASVVDGIWICRCGFGGGMVMGMVMGMLRGTSEESGGVGVVFEVP